MCARNQTQVLWIQQVLLIAESFFPDLVYLNFILLVRTLAITLGPAGSCRITSILQNLPVIHICQIPLLHNPVCFCGSRDENENIW